MARLVSNLDGSGRSFPPVAFTFHKAVLIRCDAHASFLPWSSANPRSNFPSAIVSFRCITHSNSLYPGSPVLCPCTLRIDEVLLPSSTFDGNSRGHKSAFFQNDPSRKPRPKNNYNSVEYLFGKSAIQLPITLRGCLLSNPLLAETLGTPNCFSLRPCCGVMTKNLSPRREEDFQQRWLAEKVMSGLVVFRSYHSSSAPNSSFHPLQPHL